MKKLNTRIAPSPTGDMHLGTARTAYFNFLASKSTEGKFILRVDDTDIDRSDGKFLNSIFGSLDWLGLQFDDVYYQSKRLDVYKIYIDKLIDSGRAIKKDGAVFLNYDLKDTVWTDGVKGDISINKNDLDVITNLVLWKSDGMPTYHFASVVDDIDLDINCVIRGVDHISNTSKQIAIYRALGAELPVYYHVGLLTGADGKKLSKRHGASSVIDYTDDNTPDAMLNYMLRMGWSPYLDNKENSVIGRDKAIRMFWDEGKMKPSPAKLDANKLRWYNKKHK
jgi:glutamyl-tRNA synthetase|tara:strand:+ start:20236 stop:21075 length:840 start_codon:yes stop_codon:yes gene_type:complete